jgi:hypothetical protein
VGHERASDQAELRPKPCPVYPQLLSCLPASVRSLTSPRYPLPPSALRSGQPVAEGQPIRGSVTQPAPINQSPLTRRRSDGKCCPCQIGDVPAVVAALTRLRGFAHLHGAHPPLVSRRRNARLRVSPDGSDHARSSAGGHGNRVQGRRAYPAHAGLEGGLRRDRA